MDRVMEHELRRLEDEHQQRKIAEAMEADGRRMNFEYQRMRLAEATGAEAQATRGGSARQFAYKSSRQRRRAEEAMRRKAK